MQYQLLGKSGLKVSPLCLGTMGFGTEWGWGLPAEESHQLIRQFVASGEIPRCETCGGILKPDVILMGEALPAPVIESAEREATRCDVMLIAGSSLEIAPVSHLPLAALARGAHLIIVNHEKTYLDDDASVVIHDDVAKVLPVLVERLEEDKAT